MNNIYILIGATIGLLSSGIVGAIGGAIIGWIFSGWSDVVGSIGKSEENANWKTISYRGMVILVAGALISIVFGIKW